MAPATPAVVGRPAPDTVAVMLAVTVDVIVAAFSVAPVPTGAVIVTVEEVAEAV